MAAQGFDEWSHSLLTAGFALRGRKVGEQPIRSEHEVDAAQTFDTQFVFAPGGFPEVPASVRPAAYFGRWSVTVCVHGRRGAEQRIVSAMR